MGSGGAATSGWGAVVLGLSSMVTRSEGPGPYCRRRREVERSWGGAQPAGRGNGKARTRLRARHWLSACRPRACLPVWRGDA